MRIVARLLLLAPALMLMAVAPPAGSPDGSASCRLSAADRAWLDQAFAAWAFVAREKLMLGDPPLPRMLMFDQRCAYNLAPGPNRPRPWTGGPHGGRVRLPDGQTIAVAPTAFATPVSDARESFFVMSLPAVWRAAGQRAPLGLELFLQGVMVHELTHTHQFYFINPSLEAITRRYGLPDDLTDDSLQHSFKGNPAYVADYESERETLFRAAAAPEQREARSLACEALAKLRTRRQRYFVGANAKWAPIDEVFLTMEGLGQWAMYSWWTDSRGRGVAPAAALPAVRSGATYWTQDEGLALFLTIDRLVPGWQRLAFAPRPETATALLARACG